MPSVDALWQFLPLGYLLTVAIEAPILWLALSPRHGAADRLWAGLGLTAFSYPLVAVALPLALAGHVGRGGYLLVAETLAPLSECGLFWCAFLRRAPADPRATCRDLAAIVGANLASFAIGEVLWSTMRRAW